MNQTIIELLQIGQYMAIIMVISLVIASFFVPINWFHLLFLMQTINILADSRKNLLVEDIINEDGKQIQGP